jgi:crotonobetainyl-CoA:carnitine CoA-transferase CaiB-like acyl-CoA transferase
VSGREAGRWGNGHPNLVPYQLFRAADRYLVLAVGNDGQWKGCCRALGLDVLGDDRALATNTGRLAERDRVVAAIAERLVARPASEWIAALDAAGVPCGVVKGVQEALAAVDASAATGVAPVIPGCSVRRRPPTLDSTGRWYANSGGRRSRACRAMPECRRGRSRVVNQRAASG